MKKLTFKLIRQLVKLRRREHHPLIHKVREKYKISRKTIFYMKEYGPRSHVATTILKESLPVLFISLLLSTIGGISLQTIQSNFIIFLPLLILLPALNDMMGDYSMIMVARLSTLIFYKRVKKWYLSHGVRELVRTIALIAFFSSIYISSLSSIVAYLKGFPLTLSSFAKVVEISLFTTLVMTSIVIIVSSFAVFYVYKRKEDPNNLVMPIMTSIADLGTILTLALFVHLIF